MDLDRPYVLDVGDRTGQKLVELTYKWARHSHPNKQARWIIRPYFGKFCKSRQDLWVFGDRDSALTSAGSPGQRSSGTRWSGEHHLLMTQP